MSSVSEGDGFIEVTRGSKKHKASTSPTLPNQPKPGSPLGTPVRPKPNRKNTIPAIISGVDEKFKSWRKLSGELKQYHPSLKISTVKELPKGDFLAIGHSLQDVTILQNENKMKAALVKNVKISLPKAFQISKEQQKVLQ